MTSVLAFPSKLVWLLVLYWLSVKVDASKLNVRAQLNLAHLYGAALAVLRAEPARRNRLAFLWMG